MDSTNTLFSLFRIHKRFLFLDEWGLNFVLGYLYFKKIDYRLFLIVLFYGVACIMTSYSNIHKIEESLLTSIGNNDELKIEFVDMYRTYVFLNEWLLYLNMMYVFLVKRDYKMFSLITIYGLIRVFISYCNLDRIEESLSHIHQKIWLFDSIRI